MLCFKPDWNITLATRIKDFATVRKGYFESFIDMERSFGDRHVIEQGQRVER